MDSTESKTDAGRCGFTGGAGDEAVIRIKDTGNNMQIYLDIPCKPNPEESETAVEATLDLMFEAIGIDWRTTMRPVKEMPARQQ